MKFKCSVIIDLPIEQVIQLYENPENLVYWQDDFISYEHVSGDPGTPGSKGLLKYKFGKGVMELHETIIVNDFPKEFKGKYEAKTMVNLMTNKFSSIHDNQTKYDSEIEYLEFRGIMPKLMAFFMPGVFKKQVQKWMNQFKAFAESKVND
jgi:uncharacterized membrane protein